MIVIKLAPSFPCVVGIRNIHVIKTRIPQCSFSVLYCIKMWWMLNTSPRSTATLLYFGYSSRSYTVRLLHPDLYSARLRLFRLPMYYRAVVEYDRDCSAMLIYPKLNYLKRNVGEHFTFKIRCIWTPNGLRGLIFLHNHNQLFF